MIKIAKPKFWQDKTSIYSILLLPISALWIILIAIKKNFSSKKKFNIPVICIGNIYIGGTGKTPLSIKIANELKNKKKPVIIKKYYEDQKDEHRLIIKETNCLILNSERTRALKEAERKNFNVAILDDGFQDHSIKKNLNILCFNSKQLIGNGLVFPAGPLRENIDSIREAQILVINGDKNKEFENKVLNISKNIKIYYTKYLPSNIDQFKNKKILAFAGIGNPENFFDMLTDNNLNVQKTLAFPDHYDFSKSELQKIVDESKKNNLEILTTEKDYLRIKNHKIENFKYLKIKLEIIEKDKFINQILNYI